MKLNDEGMEIIKDSESRKLKAYLCPAKIWTIGWGHTGKEVYEGLTITKEKADYFLRQDLEVAKNEIRKSVKVPLNENQYSALCSFIFNIGIGNFRSSTLLRKLNAKDYRGASLEFTRWIFSNGKPLTGLIVRREKERVLFCK